MLPLCRAPAPPRTPGRLSYGSAKQASLPAPPQPPESAGGWRPSAYAEGRCNCERRGGRARRLHPGRGAACRCAAHSHTTCRCIDCRCSPSGVAVSGVSCSASACTARRCTACRRLEAAAAADPSPWPAARGKARRRRSWASGAGPRAGFGRGACRATRTRRAAQARAWASWAAAGAEGRRLGDVRVAALGTPAGTPAAGPTRSGCHDSEGRLGGSILSTASLRRRTVPRGPCLRLRGPAW